MCLLLFSKEIRRVASTVCTSTVFEFWYVYVKLVIEVAKRFLEELEVRSRVKYWRSFIYLHHKSLISRSLIRNIREYFYVCVLAVFNLETYPSSLEWTEAGLESLSKRCVLLSKSLKERDLHMLVWIGPCKRNAYCLSISSRSIRRRCCCHIKWIGRRSETWKGPLFLHHNSLNGRHRRTFISRFGIYPLGSESRCSRG